MLLSHPSNAPQLAENRSRPLFGAAILLLLSLLLPAAGCGEDESETAEHDIHIRALWHLYLFYFEDTNQTPEDADQLKKWAEETLDAGYLRDAGIPDLDKAFISPRDGKPYVVRSVDAQYMNMTRSPGTAGAPILAYEQEGSGGKRFVVVGNAGGDPQELDQNELQRRLNQ